MTPSGKEKVFHPKSRAEQLVTTGRMVLASVFLLAVWIDPSEPSRYARMTSGILAAYLVYSLVLGVATLGRDTGHRRLQIVSHSIDLLVFAVLMLLTSGPNSLFFPYFIFILVSATCRWQWRGTLWTAIAALATTILLLWYPSNLLHDQNFELNRFIVRIVYLMVMATLLGYLGAYEQSMREVLARLAEWPRSVSGDFDLESCLLLGHAATILRAPRLLLIWEEEEEPWVHVVSWSHEGCRYDREPPSAFGSVVDDHLVETSFFCRRVGDPRSPVIRYASTGLQRWRGAPLHPEIVKRFAVGAVLVAPLKGEYLTGYLLALDKRRSTADDLVLSGIVAREIAAQLDHYLLLKQLQQTAVDEERIRLARDLHDGLLQSLSAAALQLESASRLIERDPALARESVSQVQFLLASEQRDLRTHINELRPGLPARCADDFGLTQRLDDLAERIRRQWGLSCAIGVPAPIPRIASAIAREIYFVIHEALINAVRHAGASTLRAELSFTAWWIHITVTDDGHGFPFHGCYDLDELCDMKRGPVTLRERIDALNGELSIESTESGVRLDITLPLTEQGV